MDALGGAYPVRSNLGLVTARGKRIEPAPPDAP